MREYGKVFTKIWESDDFRSLSEDGRALVLYLLTCKHITITGAFRLPDGYVCEDLQWAQERVREGFRELSAKGFATRCEGSKWVWVTKFMEWNPPENPNQRKAAAKVADGIPSQCAWKPMFMRVYGELMGLEPPPEVPPKGNPCGTLVEPFLNQEQEQEQENKSPHTPRGGKAAVSLKTWAEERRAAGEALIPDGDPVFGYAAEVGIPDEFMALAWAEFKHRYSQPEAKRYKDWRAVFRKAIRANWLKLWFVDAGAYRLTTAGQQAQRAKVAA